MKIEKKRPEVITIAAFDPSSGAGLTADIKTFENLKVYAYAVCTAITVQNENNFCKIDWLPISLIEEQIKIIFDTPNKIKYAKISMIENQDTLEKVISLLKNLNNDIKIIFDPIFSPTKGKPIHKDFQAFKKSLNNIFIITPNTIEIKNLSPEKENMDEIINEISTHCNVYLKGGHSEINKGKDFLFYNGKKYPLNPKIKNVYEKHGSGCVFSSALTAFLAKGYPVLKACVRAKRYTEEFLAYTPSLLGYHKR